MLDVRRITQQLGRRATRVFEEVTFRVPKGSVFGILGGDRSGKTTLLRTLATLLPPTSGTVTVAGLDAYEHAEKTKSLLGYQPQAPSIDRNVSIFHYLDFWAAIDGTPRSERRSRILDLLAFLDLADARDETILYATTNVQRRTYLALALLNDPPLLFLDQPTAALTRPERASFLTKLQELRAKGKTIVMTAGKVAYLETVCDRLLVLAEGRATKPHSTGDVQRIVAEAHHARAFLVTNVPPGQVAPLVRNVPGVLDAKLADPTLILFVEPQRFDVEEVRRIVVGAGLEVKNLREAEITIGDIFRTLAARDRP
jgi:ABC-type multidrug transport system ATPase subunit